MKTSSIAAVTTVLASAISIYLGWLTSDYFADYRSALPLLVNLSIFAASPWLSYLMADSVKRHNLCMAASYAVLLTSSAVLLLIHSRYGDLTALVISDKLGSSGLMGCFTAYAFKVFQKQPTDA